MLTREHFSLQYIFYLGGWANAIQQKKKNGFRSVNKPGVRLKATVLFQWGKNSYLAAKKYKYVKNQVGHREPHAILI